MDYWDAIEYILALPDLERFSSGTGGQTMSMEAMKAVLERLDHPERGRRTVHVTGSKGKGSTSTMIASILHESGFSTALYTSPHLHDYVERIEIDMLPVSRFEFADALEEIRPALEEVNRGSLGPVSTFGAMTALFFHLCRRNEVQWQIVEVGLGGTHDATNVFTEKDAAVITAVSLEHTAILGNTCAEIAREKSGIITDGCPTILACQRDESVEPEVAKICADRQAKLIHVARDYRISPIAHDSNGQSFQLKTPSGVIQLHTGMLGLHQLDNAATAVAVAETLAVTTPEITSQAISEGIANAEIPGRVEQLTRHPICVVDGAHNGESMQALVDTLSRHFDFDNSVFILGVNGDKDIAQILNAVAQMEPCIIVATRSQSAKAMPPEKIADACKAIGLECRISQNIGDAIEIAKEFAEHNDLVCITGSLYVVGEARQKILTLPSIS